MSVVCHRRATGETHAPFHRLLLALSLGVLTAVARLRRRPQAQSLADADGPFHPDAWAGSGTDIGGRLLADRLTKKWGQPS